MHSHVILIVYLCLLCIICHTATFSTCEHDLKTFLFNVAYQRTLECRIFILRDILRFIVDFLVLLEAHRVAEISVF